MKLRWPFMLRRTHEEIVRGLRDNYQRRVDSEYARATQEGRQQVHAWAREANWNIFWGIDQGSSGSGFRGDQRSRSYAALQDAERQFAPSRTMLEGPAETEDR